MFGRVARVPLREFEGLYTHALKRRGACCSFYSIGGGGGRSSVDLAASLISRMLRLRATERPTMKEVVGDPFFTGGGDGGGESKVDSEGECVVCMEGENTHIFVPCGHKCVCEGCAVLIMESGAAQCPTCRGEAERVMRIYPS